MDFSVNQRLFTLRKHLKLSQSKFGESLGVSRDVINNIDNNRVDASSKTLFLHQVCRVFSVNENWLLLGEGEMLICDHPMPSDDINSRIKLLRKSLGLSMEKFGARVGVSMGVIKNIEYHKVDAKPLLLNMISKEYGVNEEWLKHGTGEMFNPDHAINVPSVSDILKNNENNSFSLNLISVLSCMSSEECTALKHLLQKISSVLPPDQID